MLICLVFLKMHYQDDDYNVKWCMCIKLPVENLTLVQLAILIIDLSSLS